MRILITNDDGIDAEGIRILAEFAASLGEVTVIAPLNEQSGKSQGIEFTKPIHIEERTLCGHRAFAVDSTPADCVRFGMDGLGEDFDLVLSGINRGVNLGADIVYSATVGAIFEAGRHGRAGIALSTYPDSAEDAKIQLKELFEFIKEHRLTEENLLYNINIPPRALGYRITKQGSAYFSDEFERLGPTLYMQKGSEIPEKNPENPNLDTVALKAGYISITPLLQTRTSESAFERLSHLSCKK